MIISKYLQDSFVNLISLNPSSLKKMLKNALKSDTEI